MSDPIETEEDEAEIEDIDHPNLADPAGLARQLASKPRLRL